MNASTFNVTKKESSPIPLSASGLNFPTKTEPGISRVFCFGSKKKLPFSRVFLFAEPWKPPQQSIDRAMEMKREILSKVERLGKILPPNTLDQLIDELGGPENVAEMTGRKGRVVQDQVSGDVRYESRSEADIPLETLNLTEKDRFMNAEKDVAIISEAASSGISLQADRRVKNQVCSKG